VDTKHSKQRRNQRQIARRDVQKAIKHGLATPDPRNPNVVIYEHNNMKFIVDKTSNHLITSMVTEANFDPKDISAEDIHRNSQSLRMIRSFPCNWKSHTVIVVDTSGSMRKSDVSGCRTRLGVVWRSLAQDFVQPRIESGIAEDFDVVSIVLMGETATTVVMQHPTDFVLYNLLHEFFLESEMVSKKKTKKSKDSCKDGTRKRIRAGGHGHYIPSLKLAASMLEKDDNQSSVLSMLVLSDGRPSDYHGTRTKVNKRSGPSIDNEIITFGEELACKYGRRFHLSTIGIGSLKEFKIMQEMVNAAKDFGGNATFQLPSKSTSQVGAAISSIATSMTLTQTELRTGGGPRQRRVRSCLRESRKNMPLLTEIVDKEEFDIYLGPNVNQVV
jgi:hypothetical protein